MNMLYKHPRSRYLLARGLTLVELMVVIAIIAILLAVAVPSFQLIMVQNAINSATTTLASDINFARSEALKRGMSITLCTSASPYTTCTAGAPGNEWQTGWIIFLDRDANNAIDPVLANGETLLRVQQILPTGLKIQSATPGSPVKTLRFDRSGGIANAGIKIESTKLNTDDTIATQRAICIATTGRTSTTMSGSGSC